MQEDSRVPLPNKGEKQKSYIARYVQDARAKKDFPDIKQRLAVAYSEYSRKGKK